MAAPAPGNVCHPWRGEDGHGREEQEGGAEQRVLDVDRVVPGPGRQADEGLGNAIGDAAGPRERVGAHVLREGAGPDGSAQGGGGSERANQGGALHATVGLVRGERSGPGQLREEWGEADPQGAGDPRRDEREVEPAAGGSAQLLPRVLRRGGQRGKARYCATMGPKCLTNRE